MQVKNAGFMTAVLIAWVAQGSIWYTMPFIFSHTLSNNYFAVGVLISLIPLIETIVAVPFGFFTEFGKVKTATFSSMLALLAVPLLFAANIELLTAIGIFLLGAGGIGIWIAATAHMASISKRRDVKFIGYEFAVMSVGWVTGPVLGGLVYGGFGRVYLGIFEMLLLAAASFLFMKTLRYMTDVSRLKVPKFSKLLKIEEGLIRRMPRSTMPFLLESALFSFYAYMIWVAVPLITKISNESILIGGIVMGVLQIPYFFGDSFAGRLYKRRHVKNLVSAFTVLSAVFIFVSAFLLSSSFYALIILFASTLMITFADVTLFSAVVDRDRHDTGEIAALSIVTGGFGGAFAAVVVGATVQQSQLFAFAAVFGVLVLVYLAYTHITLRKLEF